mmetsp:Transcript_28474/g.41905  ORF Transcript_28474/g.41905 Transcript_28474/m.41905 type:complete len:175 (-) Transcript_28474:398-922(-)
MCGTPIELILLNDVQSPPLQHAPTGPAMINQCEGKEEGMQTHCKLYQGSYSFPGRLHHVLSCEDFRSIITWLPHGRSFIVLDPDALTTKIFPYFFRLKKNNSFIRQLSLWGFKRMLKGINAKSYYHPLFLRGKVSLVPRMSLISIKGRGRKLKSNPAEEPDLNALSKARPLPPV